MSRLNSEAMHHLTDRLLDACDGDYDLARRALDDAFRRREKFRQEVITITKQLFQGKTTVSAKVAGAVATAIHAPYAKVLRIIQKEFETIRGSGVHIQ